MTNRIDHSFCNHSRDLAGRTACRKGFAVVGDLAFGDLIRMADGRAFSVRSTFRTEIRVSIRDRANNCWSEPMWMEAADFVDATVELDPRNA
jgi:hypothetical protein